MVRIVRATAGYPEIPIGFPILISVRMAIIEPAFAWLLDLATIPGRSHAAETIRTYAEHLHDWFDSLEQSSLDWRTAGESEIAAWRNRMLTGPSPHTKRPYARSTVNDRIRTVCRFYAWAHDRGWVEALPFHFIDVRVAWGRRQNFLAHVDPHPGVTIANNPDDIRASTAPAGLDGRSTAPPIRPSRYALSADRGVGAGDGNAAQGTVRLGGFPGAGDRSPRCQRASADGVP